MTSSHKIGGQTFKGQPVIVTGGGYGIGKQIALTFGSMGANVIVAARSADKIDEVASQLRAMDTDPLAVQTDISSEESVKTMVGRVVDKYGRVEVLVNNAAVSGQTALIPDIDSEDWRKTIAINLHGTFYCCKYASQIMLQEKRGNIITLSSTGGRTGYPMRAPYSVTRWGVIGLSHTLAAELGPFGIRVNAVVPGPVEGGRSTRVFETRAQAEGISFEEVKNRYTKDIPIGRMPTEQEVANAVIYLASDLSMGIHGQTIQVDGGRRMQ